MSKGRQGARQDVLLLTASDIVEGSIDAEPSYIVSLDTLEAWERDRNQQALNPRTKRHFQVISDTDKKPLMIFQSKPVVEGQTATVISYEKQEEALTVMDRHKQKNNMLLWLGIIGGILALALAIAVLMRLKNNAAAHAAAFAPFFMLMMTTSAGVKSNGSKSPEENGKKKKKDNNKNKLEINSLDDFGKVLELRTETKNCIIIPDKTGAARFNVPVAIGLIPPESNERKYKGQPTHLLELTLDNQLVAIEPSTNREQGQSPKSLFNQLQCEREVEEAYWMGEAVLEKIKLGFLFLIIAALIGVLFMIAATATGNSAAMAQNLLYPFI